MATTRLEYVGDGSSKFWEVSTDGDKLIVRFGRIGTDGQTKTKVCGTPASAESEAQKLTAEKLKKGYAPVTGGAAAKPPSAANAPAAATTKSSATTGAPPARAASPSKSSPATEKPAAAKATPAARAGAGATLKTSKTDAPTKGVTGDLAAVRRKLEELVPAWFESGQQLGQATRDEDEEMHDESESIEQSLGKPCTEAEIVALEKHLGRPLPTSYRAYLVLHGSGKKSFGSPLGPAEHKSKDLESAVSGKSDLFAELGDTNPFEDGAIPFILDGDSRNMVLFVPPLRADGDMAVVDHDLTEERARYNDLAAYLNHQIRTAREIVGNKAKEKTNGGIRTQRQAIEAVLNTDVLSKADVKTIGLRLKGNLPGGGVPTEATIRDLKDRAETERFVARLRSHPELLADVALDLAAAAVDLIRHREQREKAVRVVELLFDSAPAKPCKPGERRHDWWLSTLNSTICQAYAAKDFELAARIADLAKPHVRESKVLHHNAACAFVAVKRYDDALEMVRVAVEMKYPQLEKLETDKDLGPLLDRPEFKALFA
jgi:predicted DNA-binding WGR domain protein